MSIEQELDTIFCYPRLKKRLESRGSLKEEKETVRRNLLEIRADIGHQYLKNFERFLNASLPNLYDGINFHPGVVDFPKLIEENCVVLTPNHQSHADYLAINYMVYKNFGIPLRVAGGDNLNLFAVGKLFRKSGCFFIRRSFHDDHLYRLTLEGYLYYLLANQIPIEFFFEGGRSRTGKLRPPRYGLFNMLIEAHEALPPEKKKPLLFLPVTIAHEYVPDIRSMNKELKGGKKERESAAKVLGLVKLFSYRFGSIHIYLGDPFDLELVNREGMDRRSLNQELAFKCFRRVGRKMPVTPSALLAFILLDEPSGALKWHDICAQASRIVDYCLAHEIPLVDSVRPNKLEETLGRTLDIMIGNGKIEAIGKNTLGHPFYTIKEDGRGEILYFKNTILHHFMAPYIINLAWIKLFKGEIQTVNDLKVFFLEQRKRLKHEFYLPTVKMFLEQTLLIISHSIGREVANLEELLGLTHKELYQLASKLGVFSRSFAYISEAYYISGLTLKILNDRVGEGIKLDQYLKTSKEVFEREMRFERVVRFSESYSLPSMETALEYYRTEKIVEEVDGRLMVTDIDRLCEITGRFVSELVEQSKFNIRAES